MTHIAIIGAGLQGATAALELASRGARMTLFEAAPAPLDRASRWNEGKLHLGYIFAKDRIDRTARLLIDGATRFAPILSRHIPAATIEGNVSPGFDYLVMPDSLLDADTLGRHYAAVTALAADALACPGRRYPGRGRLEVRPLGRAEATRYDIGAGGYATDEIAVDTVAIADAMTAALAAEPRITLRTATRVTSVDLGERAHLVTGDGRDGPFDHVVNASWDGRLTLDATVGLHPAQSHLWRRKLSIQLKRDCVTHEVPAVTMVIGPYGDIVPWPDGRTYLSWYPIGCIGRSGARDTPASWRDPASPAEARRLTDGIAAALEAIVPGVAAMVADGPTTLEGGAIFTWGRPERDVDDPESELHERWDVGVSSHGRYHTVDTGKYTLAPLFAEELAERILPQ